MSGGINSVRLGQAIKQATTRDQEGKGGEVTQEEFGDIQKVARDQLAAIDVNGPNAQEKLEHVKSKSIQRLTQLMAKTEAEGVKDQLQGLIEEIRAYPPAENRQASWIPPQSAAPGWRT